MSVIAAMVYPEKIVMAADSIMVKDWSKSTAGDFSKINEDNGMLTLPTDKSGGFSVL